MCPRHTRRALLATGLGTLTVGVAGCVDQPATSRTPEEAAATETPPSTTPVGTPATRSTAGARRPEAVGVETVAEGLTAPLAVAVLQDGSKLIADQAGTIRVLENGTLRETPVLDLGDRLVDLTGYEERGLLGLAVHPEYPADNRVFVRYSAPPRAGTPDGYFHTFVLSSFAVDPDALVADPESERPVLELAEPQANHNAGGITFGPDGYLYVGVGDGGGANDTGTGHVEDWYGANAGGNGQDVTRNLLGSILRLDVTDTGDHPYTVPDSNPLVGREGRSEQFAWGFRNPWRLSFSEGVLYAADVGQNRFEEVDLVRKGGNYGWNVREGAHCFSTASPSDPPASCPTETADGEPLIQPVIEYPHAGAPVSGFAVIGGYVYTGESIPGLRGRYVFADWRAGGTLFVGTPTEDKPWRTDVLSVESDAFGQYVLGFGRDRAGEIYVCTTDQGQVAGQTGAVHRVTPA